MLTLVKLAIKDPESSDMVVLSNISEGVDGASAFGFSIDGRSVSIEDGQMLEYAHEADLDVKVLRASDSDLAVIDGLAGKRVEVSGWTLEGFMIFRGQNILTRVPDFDSDILNDQIKITLLASKGYIEE